MSELINNAKQRRDLLKHLIQQLHHGEAPGVVRSQLARLFGEVPYHEVVAVEQELIAEGMPTQEVLSFCDLHSAALRGKIDQAGSKTPPPGHPVDTFKKENRAIEWELKLLDELYNEIKLVATDAQISVLLSKARIHFNALADVNKHYRRKENLVFPFLEKHGITGPPTVMWGKHDETRELLKAADEALRIEQVVSANEARTLVELVFKPATGSIAEMIYKEEQILFPMCMDTLTEQEWYQVYRQSLEIGYCLLDPSEEWQPQEDTVAAYVEEPGERVQLPSGSLMPEELTAILNTIPFDLTFVDKDDTVRYFTQGRERIFDRNRAILGRKVQMCHPPSSVHVVEKILEDFKSGKENRSPFWITMKGRFIHIEYFALRNKQGDYLGTLEVSQDLTDKRALTGEQRLLSYAKD
jgi:uncharacterized protein